MKLREMKGMKPPEFIEMLTFIQKYHKFALWLSDEEVKALQQLYPKMNEYGFGIKYIDSCYDSRFGDIWSISFRGMGNDVCFHTNNDLLIKYNTLFEWVMAFLKSEWVPNEKEFKSIKREKQ